MIPLKDENPSKTIPILNVLLILANISVFMFQSFYVIGGPERLFFRLGLIPYEYTHFVDISPKNMVPVPLTIFSSMFMHGGWLHAIGNMWWKSLHLWCLAIGYLFRF